LWIVLARNDSAARIQDIPTAADACGIRLGASDGLQHGFQPVILGDVISMKHQAPVVAIPKERAKSIVSDFSFSGGLTMESDLKGRMLLMPATPGDHGSVICGGIVH
jgi:hypothetical protein